jgi:hypothetical protein
MAPRQQGEQLADQKTWERQQVTAGIGEHVMRILGLPGELLSVQVRPLWEGRYRVNVVVGVDITSARIAHSYFLVADGSGNVIASIPKIAKQY